MFSYIFLHFYKTLKSGLLLDFFFKKSIFNLIRHIFLIINIYFSEKNFIEYNYFKLKNLINFFYKYAVVTNNEVIFTSFSIIVLFILLFLMIL